MLTWEQDLGQSYSTEQWHLAATWNTRTSRNVPHWETCIKLIHNWHNTPETLSRIYPLSSDFCWRGCGLTCTQLHVWWSCPILRPFWRRVFQLVSEVSGTRFPMDPALALLNIGLNLWPRDSRLFTTPVFIAARAAITSQWTQQKPPSFTNVRYSAVWMNERQMKDCLQFNKALGPNSKKNYNFGCFVLYVKSPGEFWPLVIPLNTFTPIFMGTFDIPFILCLPLIGLRTARLTHQYQIFHSFLFYVLLDSRERTCWLPPSLFPLFLSHCLLWMILMFCW